MLFRSRFRFAEFERKGRLLQRAQFGFRHGLFPFQTGQFRFDLEAVETDQHLSAPDPASLGGHLHDGGAAVEFGGHGLHAAGGESALVSRPQGEGSLDDPDPEIHLEAVTAAGSWELEAAWDHVAALVRGAQTAKDLRLAAIEAAVTIRPEQVQALFDGLLGHEDEEIVEAVREALAMAEAILEGDDDDPDEDQD